MDKPLVEVETLVEAEAGPVWDALTARKSAMFMGAEVETDWGPGSPISFTGEFNGKAFKDHGEIRDVEDRRRLAFTHYSPTSGKPDVPDSYNLVDVRLEPAGRADPGEVEPDAAGGRAAGREDGRGVPPQLGGDARRAQDRRRGALAGARLAPQAEIAGVDPGRAATGATDDPAHRQQQLQ